MPPTIRKITAKYLHEPFEVTSKAKTTTAENISQRYIQVAGPRKMDALTRVLEVEPFSDAEQKLEQPPFDGPELKYRFGRHIEKRSGCEVFGYRL